MRRTVERTCAVCGKCFEVFPCRLNKVCSRQCADVIRRKKVSRICGTCGATFMIAPSHFKYHKGVGKYCSRPCSYQGIIETTRTKPIKDKYQRSWRTDDVRWKLAVRVKDNYTCQRCGKHDQYIHAHHVAPRSRRPDLIREVSNGKCLCASCHFWVHHHPIEATALGLLSDATYEKARRAV